MLLLSKGGQLFMIVLSWKTKRRQINLIIKGDVVVIISDNEYDNILTVNLHANNQDWVLDFDRTYHVS